MNDKTSRRQLSPYATTNQTVTLAHGAGGKQTSDLIDQIFKAHFSNPDLTADDAAVLPAPPGRIAMTTDGFIVSPAFFPGGNIGKLSVCGTVNDLACMGAKPLYLSCAFVIEEGYPMEQLAQIAASMAATASEAGIRIVSGDTKVAGKGQADGVFITTTGVGLLTEGVRTSGAFAKPGDSVIVTGDIGRHGCTILLAREDFGIEADVTSDCAPLWGVVRSVLDETTDVHVIRDATRGGVGTVLYEIAAQSQVGIRLNAKAIPVADQVYGVCGMLGLEPLYLACEGRLVIVAPKEQTPAILNALRQNDNSKDAVQIGEITEDHPGYVTMTTEIGAQTILPGPGGELLPRIC
ncbi:MAG: hydrogenase expression/formation protein HypE [Clostridiales bacterium]|nr:hydrogenase expression/formation protein HypE [Clostridiales bacterium]